MAKKVVNATDWWDKMHADVKDIELGRLRKGAFESAIHALARLREEGVAWRTGFWAGYTGNGDCLKTLAKRYPEVQHGRGTGAELRRLAILVREAEEKLGEKP